MWSGSGVTLSMFLVLRSGVVPELELSFANCRPRDVSTYDLEDVANVLSGRRVLEYDARFDEVPADLEGYLYFCLCEAMMHCAEVAWFGFEGSFDFEFLLSPEIAPQIYAIADVEGIAIATDDRLSSTSWEELIVHARQRLLSTT